MPSSKQSPLTPDDLYRMRLLTECALSPDGRWLATTVRAENRASEKKYRNIWLIPVRGGRMIRFTHDEHIDASPRFSPDGRLLAFLSDRSGGNQVHLIRTEGGESWQLTRFAGSVWDFTWSPDGKSLCVVFALSGNPVETTGKDQGEGKSKKPLVHHITGWSCAPDTPPIEVHIVNAGTGRSRVLVKDEYSNGPAVFTPDDKWVIFCSNRHPDRELEPLRIDLWRISADGKGKPRKIATHDGPAYYPAVSPDGKWIAFRGCSDPLKGWSEQNIDLFVVPLRGGKPRNLSGTLDRTAVNMVVSDAWGHAPTDYPLWSPDSRDVYSVITTEGNVEIHRFSMDSGECTPLFTEPGVVLSFAIDFCTDKFYCAFSNTETPSDLFSRPLAGGRLKQLTHVNMGWLSRRSLGKIEQMRCKGADGDLIQGWLVTPPGFSTRRKYPAVLYIHGGPHIAYGNVLMHEFQYLAGLGYVVFYCNPRGSQGYGAGFLGAIANDWGNHDYRDLMKFTDSILRRYRFIDRERLGVTGGSYGGFMTNWIIGHTHRFRAAVTQRSVSNFLSWFGSNRGGCLLGRTFSSDGKTPWEDRERLLSMSPMSYMVNAATPTLVIHSEEDIAAPLEQGQQVYVQLKLQGVETEFVRFPEEGHELSRSGRTDRRIERLKHISGWFDKYLKHSRQR